MGLVGKTCVKKSSIYKNSIHQVPQACDLYTGNLLPNSSKHEWKKFNTILLFCCQMEVRNRQVSRRAEYPVFRKYLGCHEGGELSIICRHPMRAEHFVAINLSMYCRPLVLFNVSFHHQQSFQRAMQPCVTQALIFPGLY